MNKKSISRWVWPALRILVGVVFVTSGTEKLLKPVDNFMYVIQGYDVLRMESLERFSAVVFPWVELFLGAFLLLGLWTRLAILGAWASMLLFIGMLSQALLRKLPITDCGCFGDLVKVPLQVTLTMDISIFIFLTCMYLLLPKTRSFSLDRHLESV